MRLPVMLIKMHIKSQMEYRSAFLLDRFAQILAYGGAYAGIWVLLNRFETLGGWIWPELALLLSFQLMSYALGAAFSFTQFRNFEDLVRLGTFDALLVKPISPWMYLTFSGLNIGYAGHLLLGAGLMIWSLGAQDISLNFVNVAYLLGALLSASAVVAAIMTTLGASAMIFIQSRHLYAIFFGFWDLGRYPLHIFPVGLQWLMLTAVPLAFTGYVPVASLLGKDVVILGDHAGFIAILAGPIAATMAAFFWKICLKRYQSGGG